jgi:hypothetical protein
MVVILFQVVADVCQGSICVDIGNEDIDVVLGIVLDFWVGGLVMNGWFGAIMVDLSSLYKVIISSILLFRSDSFQFSAWFAVIRRALLAQVGMLIL